MPWITQLLQVMPAFQVTTQQCASSQGSLYIPVMSIPMAFPPQKGLEMTLKSMQCDQTFLKVSRTGSFAVPKKLQKDDMHK